MANENFLFDNYQDTGVETNYGPTDFWQVVASAGLDSNLNWPYLGVDYNHLEYYVQDDADISHILVDDNFSPTDSLAIKMSNITLDPTNKYKISIGYDPFYINHNISLSPVIMRNDNYFDCYFYNLPLIRGVSSTFFEDIKDSTITDMPAKKFNAYMKMTRNIEPKIDTLFFYNGYILSNDNINLPNTNVYVDADGLYDKLILSLNYDSKHYNEIIDGGYYNIVKYPSQYQLTIPNGDNSNNYDYQPGDEDVYYPNVTTHEIYRWKYALSTDASKAEISSHRVFWREWNSIYHNSEFILHKDFDARRYTFTKVKYPTPNLQYNDHFNYFYWDHYDLPFEGNKRFIITINGTRRDDTVVLTSEDGSYDYFYVPMETKGTWNVTVMRSASNAKPVKTITENKDKYNKTTGEFLYKYRITFDLSFYIQSDVASLSVDIDTTLEPPTNVNVLNVNYGHHISWNLSYPANLYKVYVKYPNSDNYIFMASTQSTSIDVDAVDTQPGTTQYGVIAVWTNDESFNSTMAESNQITVNRLEDPVLTLTQENKNHYLSWNTIQNADRYEIWKKYESENLNLLYTTTETSYTVNAANVEVGSTTYLIKAILDDNSDYDSAGFNTETINSDILSTPQVTVEEDNRNHVITWNAVQDASGYNLTIINPDATERIVEGIQTTTYTNDILNTQPGTTLYSVQAVLGTNPAFNSNYSTPIGADLSSFQTPVLTLTDGNRNHVLTWTKTTNVTGYNIYRKAPSDADYTITAISGVDINTYTFNNTLNEPGETLYKIQSVYAPNENFNSEISAPVSITSNILDRPNIDVQDINKSHHISWDYTDENTSFNIYRKAPGETEFTLIDNITNQFYDVPNTDTKPGTTEYKVSALFAYNNLFDSEASNSSSVVSVILDTPILNGSDDNGTHTLTWEYTDTADYFNIYRKAPSDADYIYLNKVDKDGIINFIYSIEATNTEPGTSKYKIKAIYDDNNLYNSNDSVELNIISYKLDTPAINGSESYGNHTLTWEYNDVADYFNIYRKEPGETEYSLYDSTTEKNYLINSANTKPGDTNYYIVAVFEDNNLYNSNDSNILNINSVILSTPEDISTYKVTGTTTTGNYALSWNAVDGTNYYNIYYRESNTDPFISYPGNPVYSTNISYTVIVDNIGGSYREFKVQAVNNLNNLYNSNESNIFRMNASLLDVPNIYWGTLLPSDNLYIDQNEKPSSYTLKKTKIFNWPINDYATFNDIPTTNLSEVEYYRSIDNGYLYQYRDGGIHLVAPGTVQEPLLQNITPSNYKYDNDIAGNYIINITPSSSSSIIAPDGSYTFYFSSYTANGVIHNIISNTLYFNTSKLEWPGGAENALTIDADNKILYWPAVIGVDKYRITYFGWNENDTEERAYQLVDGTETSVAIPDLYKNNSFVYIEALAPVDTIVNLMEYNNRLDSVASNTLSYGTLSAPVISIDPNIDNKIIWNNVPNANYYEIYDGLPGEDITSFDSLIYTTSDTYYMVQSSIPKTYNLKVKAISDTNDGSMGDSVCSNSVSIKFNQLETPLISIEEETIENKNNYFLIVSNNSIENINMYDIYINNKISLTVTPIENQRYNITNELRAGNNLIYAIAKSEDPLYLDSNKSIYLLIDLLSKNKYTALINNSNYEILLPFNLQKGLDNASSFGSITLAPSNINIPFEAYTDIEINIYDENQTSVLKKYFYSIEKDEKEEIQLGENSTYLHHLTLIDRSKALETVIEPDMTITQPLGRVLQEYTKTMYPNTGGNYDLIKPNTLVRVAEEVYGAAGRSDSTSQNFVLLGSNGNTAGLTHNLFQSYSIGGKAILPIQSAEKVYTEHRSNDLYNLNNYYSTELKGHILTRHYYWRKHSSSYNVDPACPEHLIGTTYDLTLLNYIFNNSGEFDIIMTIDPITATFTYEKYVLGVGKVTETITSTFDLMSSRELSFENNAYHPEDFVQYRVVYNQIKGAGTQNYTSAGILVDQADADDANTYYVSDVLEKLITNVRARFEDGHAVYQLDPYIKSITSSMISPEFKFEKGRSLYENLATVGRLFSGYPRLGKNSTSYIDNMITFDILEKTDNALPNSAFDPYKNVLGDESASMDNYATGFVSDIKNLISDDLVECYPFEDGWISPKSIDPTNAYLNRSNMGIVLPKNIFRITKVEVMYDNNEIYDITSYVVEKKIYDSLKDIKTEKGSNLYWSRGDNKIYNLGCFSNVSSTEALFGLSSTEYIIDQIYYMLTGAHVSPTVNQLKYKYRIHYVPYTDATIYTEQENTAQLNSSVYKVLNQESNVISDVNFAHTAQQQIERIGNNSITKKYILNNLSTLPNPGNSIVINNSIYYADNIEYEFNSTDITCLVEYSKDLNKINDRVGIDSSYREYEIYDNDYVDRNININDYCYVSTNKYDIPFSRQTKLNYPLCKILKNSFEGDTYHETNPYYRPEMLYGNANTNIYNLDGSYNYYTRLKYSTRDEDGNLINKLAGAFILPVNTYILNSSVLLTAKTYDNFSVGVNAYIAETGSNEGKMIQKDIRYVDDLGKADLFNITIGNFNSIESRNKLLQIDPAIDISLTYPEALYKTDVKNYFDEATVVDDSIMVEKDNREALVFNYQLHFVTKDKNISIHSGLTKYLYKINKSSANQESPTLVLFTDKTLSNKEYYNEEYLVPPGPFGEAPWLLPGANPHFEIETLTNSHVVVIKPFSGGDLTLPAGTLTPLPRGEHYNGYAYIWHSSRNQLLVSVKQDIDPYKDNTIKNIYFNFSGNKLTNNELDALIN